jgi:hypothetical protein
VLAHLCLCIVDCRHAMRDVVTTTIDCVHAGFDS